MSASIGVRNDRRTRGEALPIVTLPLRLTCTRARSGVADGGTYCTGAGTEVYVGSAGLYVGAGVGRLTSMLPRRLTWTCARAGPGDAPYSGADIRFGAGDEYAEDDVRSASSVTTGRSGDADCDGERGAGTDAGERCACAGIARRLIDTEPWRFTCTRRVGGGGGTSILSSSERFSQRSL